MYYEDPRLIMKDLYKLIIKWRKRGNKRCDCYCTIEHYLGYTTNINVCFICLIIFRIVEDCRVFILKLVCCLYYLSHLYLLWSCLNSGTAIVLHCASTVCTVIDCTGVKGLLQLFWFSVQYSTVLVNDRWLQIITLTCLPAPVQQ